DAGGEERATAAGRCERFKAGEDRALDTWRRRSLAGEQFGGICAMQPDAVVVCRGNVTACYGRSEGRRADAVFHDTLKGFEVRVRHAGCRLAFPRHTVHGWTVEIVGHH